MWKQQRTNQKYDSCPVLPIRILSKVCMLVPSYTCILFSVTDTEFMNDVIRKCDLGIWILLCAFATVELRNPKCPFLEPNLPFPKLTKFLTKACFRKRYEFDLLWQISYSPAFIIKYICQKVTTLRMFPILLSPWQYEWILNVCAWMIYQSDGLGFDDTVLYFHQHIYR